MLRHRKKHSGALSHMSSFQNLKSENGENGNGSSINNSASDMSDDESSTLAMINNKKLREMMPQEPAKSEQDASRMMSQFSKEIFMKFQEKFFSMHQHGAGSNLLENLLGISDQSVLNKMFSAPEEAAKLLGVEK